jgi:lipopolysaccharide biosynthesis glycosyltransferase
MKGIHIVCVSNDSFAKYLGVMLTSLLENKTSKEPITIYIIDGGITKNKKKKLKRLRQKYNANLKFLSINQNYYDDLKMRGHVSKETYYRISIPNLLNRNIKKVIYLDSDLVIKDNIANLWNVNVENHYLAAAEDPVGTTGEDKGRFGMRCKALSIPEKCNYFNAGVMLMNLEKWRKDHIAE